jgi:hypothetical protein
LCDDTKISHHKGRELIERGFIYFRAKKRDTLLFCTFVTPISTALFNTDVKSSKVTKFMAVRKNMVVYNLTDCK